MASRKKKPKKKSPPKPKSKKLSSVKVRSKVSTSRKSKKSVKSKSSLKVVTLRAKAKKKTSKKAVKKKAAKKLQKSETTYSLVTLDAISRKVIKPKIGQQIFFAWKSSKGKIYPIESQYSQAYYKTDAEGLIRSFKAGSPSAYNVYKELTKETSKVIDKYGNLVDEVKVDKHTGEVRTIFRWKITGRNTRKGQSVSIQSVTKGFIMPLTRGFPSLEPREIPIGGYKKVKVTYKRGYAEPQYIGRFQGDSIRTALEKVLPNVSTKELRRKNIKTLVVLGFIDIYKPENPYLEDTPDWHDREKWSRKIWKDKSVRRFKCAASVPVLMDFVSRTATQFRQSFSTQGLRITSLVDLEEAVERQSVVDNVIFEGIDPVASKIIETPRSGVRYHLGVEGRAGKHVPADKYFPVRYEAMGGEPSDRTGSKYDTIMDMYLSINALKKSTAED